jgi:excisionase family DNA binding protein
MQQIIIQGYTLEQLAEALKPLLQKSQSKTTDQEEPQESKQEEPQESVLLTRDEVCDLLKFNKTTLHKHTRSGRLKSYGIGNRVLYKRSEVLEAVKPINH